MSHMHCVHLYRFRHAVVRTLTGKGHSAHKRTMADVVEASIKIEKNRKEGKKPEGRVNC